MGKFSLRTKNNKDGICQIELAFDLSCYLLIYNYTIHI
jgi:hypothetical protein